MKRIALLLSLSFLIITACSSGSHSQRTKPANSKEFGMYEVFIVPELMYTLAIINELPSSDSTSNSKSNNVKLQDLMQWGNDDVIGYTLPDKMSAIDSIFNLEKVRKMLPSDLRFVWSVEPVQTSYGSGEPLYALYAIKVPENGPRIGNKDIASATTGYNENEARVSVSIEMTEDGAYEWEAMTRDNLNRFIAIVLDDKVYSCPKVISVISAGKTEISGNFSKAEAEDLAMAIAP